MSMSSHHQGRALPDSSQIRDVSNALIPRLTFGIRTWLAALVGFALLPIVLFSINEAREVADAAQKSTLADLERRTQSAATSVERHVVSLTQTAIALANAPAILAGDQRESYEFARRVMTASHSSSFATLIAPDGRMIFTTRRSFGEALPKVGDTAGYSEAMAAKAPRTSDLFRGNVAGSPLAAVWAPTVRGDEIIALTTVTIEPPELTARLRDEHLPDGWTATIVDRRGTIVARSVAPERWIGAAQSGDAPAAVEQAMRGVYSLVNEDGARVLSYFIALPSSGWRVIVSVPKEQFDAPVNTAWRFMAALGFLSLAIAGGLALLVGRHLSLHVISIAEDAAAICAGRSAKTGRSGIRELDSTSAALLGATQRLVSNERELRRSERRLDAVLNSLPIGVALVDLRGEPIVANKMFNEMLVPEAASSRGEVRHALWEDFGPGGQRFGDSDNPPVRALRGERVWPGEELLFRGDESRGPFWTRVAALPYQDENGQTIGATAVIVDIDTQKKAHDALAENEARLQMALDADGAGIWEVSDDGREFVASDRALILLGRHPGTALTHNEALAAVHPEDRQKVEKVLRLTFAASAPFRVELRCPRPDGSIRWLQSQGELKNFRGRRRLMGLVRDITDRKRAEEHLYLLMHEVNHRSRNMLAVVHSIARQTAASNMEEFIEHFSERIQALSANQDVLIKNDWRGADVEELVRAHLAPFGDLIDGRIQVQGPHLRVAPSAAQSIGLAIHELATNASKYGSLSGDQGCVVISWQLDGDEFTINWAEYGGPCVKPPTRKGFGNIVTCQIAKASVEGHVELDYRSTGLIWSLKCPASKALD
jgi:PAS domain S-box-containing protein